MSTLPSDIAAPAPARFAHAAFFGHPKGLAVLFATEMWERFAFFGNAALIVLYMVSYLLVPGHVEAVIGFGAVRAGLEVLFGAHGTQPLASALFGFYSGLAYLSPILGGFLADRLLGPRRSVVIGAVLMAAGQFMMAFDSLFLFALVALIFGNGALKPNVSTQVGALYPLGDPRRDRGYSIFYLGINVGAFLAPLVCGTLAAMYGWHTGFAASGVGMLISLAIYLSGLRTLVPEEHARPAQARAKEPPLTDKERRAVAALFLVCALSIFFWATYDQQNNTLLLWIEEDTRRSLSLFGHQVEVPAAWFLSLDPLMVFAFTPVIVRLWAWQSTRGIRRTLVTKMSFACWAVALANLVLIAAAFEIGPDGRSSAWWIVLYFALVTVGELYLAPAGLSLIATIAPLRLRSLLMGVWLAVTFPADVFGGWLGGFWSGMNKMEFYLVIALIAGLGGSLIWVLRPIVWAAWPDETKQPEADAVPAAPADAATAAQP